MPERKKSKFRCADCLMGRFYGNYIGTCDLTDETVSPNNVCDRFYDGKEHSNGSD